ncbi:hypothetical protein SJ299_25120, partial [Enterobacter hormaechei]|uniref:PASTA domain-containing protein n=1 Tax=Enterobacter hormaechei TaxID=158836 RepID=UPI0029D7D152
EGEDGDGEDPLTKPFWTRRKAIAAGAVAALLAGAGLAFALTRSSEVEVPNVTGSQQAEAESRLDRAGFESAISQEATCEDAGV